MYADKGGRDVRPTLIMGRGVAKVTSTGPSMRAFITAKVEGLRIMVLRAQVGLYLQFELAKRGGKGPSHPAVVRQ